MRAGVGQEVWNRGPLPLGDDDTVFSVLAKCGWQADANLFRVTLIRPDGKQPVTMESDVGRMIATGAMDANFQVRSGDILFVPRLDRSVALPPLKLAVGSRLDFVLYCDLKQPGCEQLRKLTEPQTVGRDGTIFVPYVGHLVVLGKTKDEVAAMVQVVLAPAFHFKIEVTARFLQ